MPEISASTTTRIVVGADPVFTLTTDRGESGAAPTVGVVVRNWDGVSAWLTPLAQTLDRLADERSATVRLIPFQTGRGGNESDDLVAMRLAARMESATVDSLVGVGADPDELAKLIAGCDALVGMRLHSLVFAAAARVPTVALAYDPKVTQAMGRIGRSDFVAGLDDPDADWLYDRVCLALDSGASADEVFDLVGAVERAGAAVLTSDAASPPLPDELVPALVSSLASAAADVSRLSGQLDTTRKELDERGHYLNDRVAELQAVRSEFQAFRDARAVKLAQLAWDGRRAATEAVSTIRERLRNPESQLEVDGLLSIADIVAANTDSAGFVVFAPSIHWDVELFQRPQQMALAFARQGHTVLYQVDEQYRNGLTGYRQVGERIYEGYLEPDRYEQLDQIPDPLFLSYVYNYAWGRNLTNAHAVYEHIDDLEVFEQVYGRHDLDRWHTEALHNADVVVGSAVDLMADLTPVRPDALLVPNGVDVDHFRAEDRSVPDDISELVAAGTPIIGYYGALAEWFDYGLLRQLAERLDGHAFVLIGPDYDGTLPRSEVTELANVHWLGPKPYASLPAYLDRFAVATIPFVVNEVTHAVSPLKLFEYMAGGKPVITPPLRECARYREVLLADGVDEWAEMIELAVELGADDSFRSRMIAAAEQNTWDARVRTILDAVQMTDDR